MKKSMACLSALLLLTSGALAANDAKEVERVKEAGEVLKEILNIPDDIPQDLLDKARVPGYSAFGEERRIWGRWKLRPRRHDLPQR